MRMKTAKALLGVGLVLGTTGVLIGPAEATTLTAPSRVYSLLGEPITFDDTDAISQQSRVLTITGNANDACVTTATTAVGGCTFVQIGLTGGGNGVFTMDTAGIGVVAGAFGVPGTINFGGKTADVNDALKTLTYTPEVGFETFDSANDRETMEISVSGAGAPEPASTTIDIRVLQDNALPEVTVPGNTTATAGGADLFFTELPPDLGFIQVSDEDAERDEEDQDLVLAVLWVDECGEISGFDPGGITDFGAPDDLVSAIDAGGEIAALLATFDLPENTAFATDFSNPSTAHAVIGDLVGVQESVERLFFHPPADGDCTATINVLFTDLGNNGAPILPGEIPVPLPAFDSWDITVRDADNDAPVVTAVPASQDVAEGDPAGFAFTVTDSDAEGDLTLVSLDSDCGVVTGAPDPLPFNGSADDITSALSALSITAPGQPTCDVTATVTDNGFGPADPAPEPGSEEEASATATFVIDEDEPPVNVAPTIIADPVSQPVNEGDVANFEFDIVDLDSPSITLTDLTSTCGPVTGAAVDDVGSPATLLDGLSITAPGNVTCTVEATIDDGPNAPVSATATFTITLDTPNDPPTITADPADQNVDEGDVASFEFDIVDADSPSITLTALTSTCGPVTGATVGDTGSPATLLAGLSITAPGTASCTVEATIDDGPNDPVSATATFTITLNVPPTIVADPVSQDVNEGDVASFEFDIVDADSPSITLTALTSNCGPVTGATVGDTGSPATLLAGLSITAPGTASCTVEATVDDGPNDPVSATATFDITLDADNVAPTITADPADQSVNEGDVANFEFDITDPDNPTVTLTAFTSTCGDVTGAPVVGTTATLATLLDALSIVAPGVASCTVSATIDDGPNAPVSAVATFTITLDPDDPDNEPPTIVADPPSQDVVEGDTASFEFDITDDDDPQVTLIALTSTCGSVNGAPSVGTTAPLGTLLDNLSITVPVAASCTVSVTITDGDDDASAVATFNITDEPPVDVNEAPTIDGPDLVPLTVVEGGLLPFTVLNRITIADDADPTDELLLTITQTGGAGVSAAVVPGDTAGTLAQLQLLLDGLVFTAGAPGAASVTIVIDDQGNTGTGGALTDSLTIPITVTAAQGGTTTTTSTTLPGGGSTSTTAGPNVGAGGIGRGGAGSGNLPRTGADLLLLAGAALVLTGVGGLLTGRRGRTATI